MLSPRVLTLAGRPESVATTASGVDATVGLTVEDFARESRRVIPESAGMVLLDVDCVLNNHGVAITTTAVRTSARRNRLSIAFKHDYGTGS